LYLHSGFYTKQSFQRSRFETTRFKQGTMRHTKTLPFKSIKLLILILTITACRHEPDAMPDNPGPGPDTTSQGIPCDPDTIYFTNDILPILTSGCTMSGCHDAASASDGIVLTSWESVMASGVVRPGNPGDSDLYENITEDDPDKRMPPPPMAALQAEQIQKIRKWIEQGARNNACTAGCDTTQFTFSAVIQPIINTYCKGCHSGVAPSGNISLDGYATIRAAALNGSLYGAVSHQPSYTPMPFNAAKLPECNIIQIRKWIENGTPEN